MRKRERGHPRSHPDPITENELERIRALQRRCDVKAEQISDYRVEIDELHRKMREWGGRLGHNILEVQRAGYRTAIAGADKRVVQLQGEIRQLEQEADDARDRIGTLQGKLDPSDLAYL